MHKFKKQIFYFFKILSIISLLIIFLPAHALVFPLPMNGDSVVGQMKIIRAKHSDTFTKIGERFNIGYYELVEANPGINPEYITFGTKINVPQRFILPPGPKKGIVINLPELRLYYYSPEGHTVFTEPVGIGKIGWMTPTGDMTIVEKRENPTWHVPESVRRARMEEGVFLPDAIPPGPYNPLGKFAIRLSELTYLIHGTNDPSGVGKRVSAGCIRMYPSAIKALYAQVDLGTQVRIINEPFKTGWYKNKLYLESHVPLQEQRHILGDDLTPMVSLIVSAAKKEKAHVNWAVAELVGQEMNGVPQIIGERK